VHAVDIIAVRSGFICSDLVPHSSLQMRMCMWLQSKIGLVQWQLEFSPKVESCGCVLLLFLEICQFLGLFLRTFTIHDPLSKNTALYRSGNDDSMV